MELTSHHPLEEFRKGQKEMPCILPPPRILLTGIHLGWAMQAPPGRMLIGQRKSGHASHPHKTQDWEPHGSSVLLGSLTSALCLGASSQYSLSLYQLVCLLGQLIPECYTRVHSCVLEWVPLPATVWHVLLLPAGLLAGGDASDQVADVPQNLMGFWLCPLVERSLLNLGIKSL